MQLLQLGRLCCQSDSPSKRSQPGNLNLEQWFRGGNVVSPRFDRREFLAREVMEERNVRGNHVPGSGKVPLPQLFAILPTGAAAPQGHHQRRVVHASGTEFRCCL